MRFIHFGYVVPQEERDPNLLSTLKSEMPGIFNWALHGLAEWKRQGLNAPEKVVNDSAEYKKELDSITEYFDENIQYQPNHIITSKLCLRVTLVGVTKIYSRQSKEPALVENVANTSSFNQM